MKSMRWATFKFTLTQDEITFGYRDHYSANAKMGSKSFEEWVQIYVDSMMKHDIFPQEED